MRNLRNASLGAYRSIRDLTAREKKFLLSEILQVKGLMPLLMKPRNKQRWTAEDRAELRIHLRRLSNLSPYLVVLALPGSFLMLPMLAWWLDRRRNRKRPPESGIPLVAETRLEQVGASNAGGGGATFACHRIGR
jgi:hypothetical protein